MAVSLAKADQVDYSRSPIATMERLMARPDPLLRDVGTLFVRSSRQAFRTQRFGRDAWAPRRVPNYAGIMDDLAAGEDPAGHRWQARPALVDTGAMERSIRSETVGGRTLLRVGVPYAGLHQYGGDSSQTVTARMQRGLARYLADNEDRRDRLGWLMSIPAGSSVRFRVRARPMVGWDPAVLPDVAKATRAHMAGDRR